MEQGFFQVVDRKEFLTMLTDFPPVGVENLGLESTLNRILAEDLTSPEDLPLAARSCMDGFAVRASDTFGAGESAPAYLEIAGDIAINVFPEFKLGPGECARIPTGGCLPDGADAVIMVEHSHEMGTGTVELRKSAAPGDHVMRSGEDARAGTPLFQRGRRIRVPEAGLMAALGHCEIPVHKRPRVAILSTGDEVLPITESPRPGQVRDVNSMAVGMLAHAAGANVTRLGIIPDDLDSLTMALKSALIDHEAVFLSGGSSVGTRDHTVAALESLPSTKILAHGVSISPGKPTILARQENKAIMGLPGQVASAQVVMILLGQPLIRILSGDAETFDENQLPRITARLSRNMASKQGREDFVRVRIVPDPDKDIPLAEPVLGKSGLLRTMVQSRGLVRIPANSEGLYQDQQVEVRLI